MLAVSFVNRYGVSSFRRSVVSSSNTRSLDGLKHQANMGMTVSKELPKVMPVFTGFKTKHALTGDIYVGDWLKGKYHGHGKMVYRANPKSKVGPPKDIMSGDGEFSYVGQWLQGKRHGHGTITYPDANTFTGEFENGELVSGKGLIFLPKSKLYEGEVANGKPHGLGTLTHKNGKTLHGLFKDGRLFEGNGVMVADDGTECVGTYEAGKRHGHCTVAYPDGRTLEGEFKNGLLFNGKGLLKVMNPATKKFDTDVEGEWGNGELIAVYKN